MDKWIGFDLDGTLAEWNDGQLERFGLTYIGKPIDKIVKQCTKYIQQGKRVKLFTARAHPARYQTHQDYITCMRAMAHWCVKYLGTEIEITCYKDANLDFFYDDKAMQVEPNTGRILEQDLDYYRAFSELNLD